MSWLESVLPIDSVHCSEAESPYELEQRLTFGLLSHRRYPQENTIAC